MSVSTPDNTIPCKMLYLNSFFRFLLKFIWCWYFDTDVNGWAPNQNRDPPPFDRITRSRIWSSGRRRRLPSNQHVNTFYRRTRLYFCTLFGFILLPKTFTKLYVYVSFNYLQCLRDRLRKESLRTDWLHHKARHQLRSEFGATTIQ